jgi:uncharacterized membrane protein YgcG
MTYNGKSGLVRNTKCTAAGLSPDFTAHVSGCKLWTSGKMAFILPADKQEQNNMDRWKIIPVIFLAPVLAIALFSEAQADERIHDYHSDVQVLKDGSLIVTEKITVNAEGSKIKRGIFRDFPIAYTSRFMVPIKLPFNVVSVKRDGKTEPFHSKKESNGVRVYVGQEEYLLPPGKYTFEITYTTNFQLGFFDTHDELYWNVTGNGWDFPIDRASASISLPEGVPRRQITHEGYTGPQGSKAANLVSAVNEATGTVDFTTSRSLGSREGLTIVVGFPKGYVHQPTAAEKGAIYLKADRTLRAVLVGLLLVMSYYLLAWFVVGRDPKNDVIFPSFEPPLGLPPACLRYLRRMGYDKKCFASALINMAVKRHIVIEEEDGNFTLRRLESAGKERLSPGEKKIFTTMLSSPSIVLKQSNHKKISKAIEKLGERLSAEYEGKLFVKNRWWLAPGWLLSAVAVVTVALSAGGEAVMVVGFLSVWLSIWTLGVIMLAKQMIAAWRSALALRKSTLQRIGSLTGAIFITAFATPFFIAEVAALGMLVFAATIWIVPLLLGLVAINWSFWHWIKQPTLEGQRVMDQIEGFRMYLGTAEGEFLQSMHPPEVTPELFEKYLPYALALGVENEWAEKFSTVLERAAAAAGQSTVYHPSWYRGATWNAASMGDFAGGLGSSLGGAVSSSSTAPGSSSGGGGGGSSGGGGGGGGGGGW